jgi:hypothetical protein
MGEQVQQTGREEREEDPAFFIFDEFIIYTACFLMRIKNLTEEEQANLIFAWDDYARGFDYKGRVSKRRAELAKNACITPWERPETNKDYFTNYIVPAFVKTFGHTAANATSYIMSADHITMLFNANDPYLFVQQEFGNQGFRELLKKSLANEPLFKVSKEKQMQLEFIANGDIAEIRGNYFRRDKLVQIIHVLRADSLQLYFLMDETGNTKDRPLLVSDGFGHFIALPPVTIRADKEADKEEEPTSKAGSEAQEQEEQESTPSSLNNTQSEALVEERPSPDPNLIIERHKQIIELRERGRSYRGIARRLKVSKSTVALELKQHRELRCDCEHPKIEVQENSQS